MMFGDGSFGGTRPCATSSTANTKIESSKPILSQFTGWDAMYQLMKSPMSRGPVCQARNRHAGETDQAEHHDADTTDREKVRPVDRDDIFAVHGIAFRNQGPGSGRALPIGRSTRCKTMGPHSQNNGPTFSAIRRKTGDFHRG